MSSVGAYLRDLRQRRGVSLEEIARTTRVGQRYLEAIETEAFDTLPAPVFIRGFIRAYCQALGESPEEALAIYDGRQTRAVPTAPHAVPPRAPTESEPRARGAVLVSFVLLVVLGMALFTVALLIHPRERAERVAVEVRPEPRPETRPVPPPIDLSRPIPVTPAPRATPAPSPVTPSAPPATTPPAPRATPGPTPATPSATTPPPVAAVTPSPPTSPPAAAPAPPAPPAVAPPPNLEGFSEATSPYRLVARTNETTWIRVRTEDGRTSEENVPPGEVREWISNRPFVLTIGNAGGVSFELNGRPLPALGAKGAVIQRLVLPPESR